MPRLAAVNELLKLAREILLQEETPESRRLLAVLDQASRVSGMKKTWTVTARPPKGKDGRNWQLRYFPPPGMGRPGKEGKPYQRSAGTPDEVEAWSLARSEEARLNGTSLPLSEVLRLYLEHREQTKKGSERTLETYRSRARRLVEVHGDGPIDEVSILKLQDALCVELAARSVNKRLELAEAAWTWARSRGHVQDPWPSGIPRLEEAETDKRPCTDQESFRILSEAMDYAGGYYYPILAFLSDVGSRVTETSMLREKDVNRARGEVRFSHAKGKRPRTVVVSRDVLELVPESDDPEALLFPARTDPTRPVNRNVVYQAFRTCLERLGLEKEPIEPHSLRRSWITDSLREGVAMGQSMLQTGHSTTAIHLGYRRNAPNRALRAAHQRVKASRPPLPHQLPTVVGGAVLQDPQAAGKGRIPAQRQGDETPSRSE